MPTFLERLQEAVGLRYRIDLETEVGTGGQAHVFRAHDSQLDCPVAIKALRPELVTATAAERFLREAQILANLPHPNSVPIRDYGSRNGIDFYIMQWLGAETPAQRLARGRLSLHEAQHLTEGLYEALAGRDWRVLDEPDREDWSDVPSSLRAVLVKFIDWAPSDRWADADEF